MLTENENESGRRGPLTQRASRISLLVPTRAGHLIAFLVILATTAAADGHDIVLHVDDDAPPGGNGLTWTTAHRFLQDALAAAREPGSGVVEIRIAGGVYKPDRSEAHPEGTGDRDVSFEVVSGVAHRGGYAGLGFPDPDFRSLEYFETVLSGDLAGDDGPPGEFENDDENSHYVMNGSDLAAGTLLDGVMVTAGNNDIPIFPGELRRSSGAGLNVVSGELTVIGCRIQHNRAYSGGGCFLQAVDLSIENSLIEGNLALNSGGGLYLDGGTFAIADSVFIQNKADYEDGGGLAVMGLATGEIRGTTFELNSGDDGGGVSCTDSGHVAVTDCRFYSNFAAGGGGAWGGNVYDRCEFRDNLVLFGGGGLRTFGLVTHCVFSGNGATSGIGGGAISGGGRIFNCIFEDNFGVDGGALSFFKPLTLPPALVVNCIMRGNRALWRGGAVFGKSGDSRLVNCTLVDNVAGIEGGATAGSILIDNAIVWRNVPDQLLDPIQVRYSCVQGGWPGEGNIDAPPHFDGPRLSLSAQSPCIDAGDSAAVPPDMADLDADADVAERVPLDLAGNNRFADDPATADSGSPAGGLPFVDMGAYEFPPQVFGDIDGDGWVNITDLLLLLDAWGPCPDRGDPWFFTACAGDLDHDGRVDSRDLLLFLAAW